MKKKDIRKNKCDIIERCRISNSKTPEDMNSKCREDEKNKNSNGEKIYFCCCFYC